MNAATLSILEAPLTSATDTAPVVTDFGVASTPVGAIAQRLLAEANEQRSKVGNTADRKAGTLRIISTGRADLYRVNPYALKIKADWNGRDLTSPENQEHIDALAISIAQEGVKQTLTVVVEGNELFVTDGHCRLLATFRAIEVYGAEIASVPVQPENKYASEADRVSGQLSRNSGKPFTVLEQGKVFVRLSNFGWPVKKIAAAASCSPARVSQILDLMAGTTDEIRDLIASGQMAATNVAAIIRNAGHDGAAASETLKASVAIAKAEGKTKATAKHIKAAAAAAAGTETSTAAVFNKQAARDLFENEKTSIEVKGAKTTIVLSSAQFRLFQQWLGLV